MHVSLLFPLFFRSRPQPASCIVAIKPRLYPLYFDLLFPIVTIRNHNRNRNMSGKRAFDIAKCARPNILALQPYTSPREYVYALKVSPDKILMKYVANIHSFPASRFSMRTRMLSVPALLRRRKHLAMSPAVSLSSPP